MLYKTKLFVKSLQYWDWVDMFYAKLIVFYSLNINFVNSTIKILKILKYDNGFVLKYRWN